MFVMLYAGRNNIKYILDDEDVIGIPLDAYIPGIKTAFVFPYRGTNREEGELRVLQHLCEKRGISFERIASKDPVELCIAIKQAFAKAHIYIHSNPESDIAIIRERFMTWRKRSHK